MARIYAVVNQKGGVGKTTTAVNLAAAMALAGKRVLLVDLDSQGNATSGLGIDRAELKRSLYDVLVDDLPAADAVVPGPMERLSVLPSTIDLAGAEIEMAPRLARETVLRSALESVRDRYDIILMDGPPSLGLLTLNALVAAQSLILPIQTEYYALEGISQLLKTVDLVRRALNPALQIQKVILTMHDTRTRLASQVAEDVRAHFRDKVSSTVVPRNVRLSEAPSHGLPVALYDARSRGAKAYADIAREVLRDG